MNKKREKLGKTIVYVNFSPYENAGNILDFLLDNFTNVILFAFNFYRLGEGQKPPRVIVYRNRKSVKEYQLLHVLGNVPKSMLFFFIPFRSFINFLQIFWYLLVLKKRFKRYDIYFTVNAFTAWVGNVLRSFGIVNKTIFWVWDYYPPLHPNKIILLIRWIYWQFDKMGIASDKTVFLSKRLLDLRKDINILPQNADYKVIPIGTNPKKKISAKSFDKQIVVGFLGVVKESQGLDLFFDCAKQINKKFPRLRLEIIGSGPDEEHFKMRAKKAPVPVVFHGFVRTNAEIEHIQSAWHIGIALYAPDESNVSYYTDTSKIKGYLSLGIPVIATNVFSSFEVVEQKAGIIIDYHKKRELVQAIEKILGNYRHHQKQALLLAKKYHYKRIYKEIFA